MLFLGKLQVSGYAFSLDFRISRNINCEANYVCGYGSHDTKDQHAVSLCVIPARADRTKLFPTTDVRCALQLAVSNIEAGAMKTCVRHMPRASMGERQADGTLCSSIR